MNNNKISIILLLVLVVSCSDNFLDKKPPQDIAADAVWKNESDVQMGLTGCYARLRGTYLTWTRSYFDAAVDNGWAQHFLDIRNMQTGTLDETNSGAANALYKSCYQGIASCNVFLMNYGKAGLAEDVVAKYVAEARFLRAFFYFELVQRWGGVVIYKEIPSSLDGLKIPKSTEEQVYGFIKEDLDFAVANLPEDKYAGGHAVKTSALALQARIALFKNDWDKVIELTEAIIASGKYTLASDLESQFIKGKGQSDCPEIIFSAKYIETKDGRQGYYGQEIEFFRWGGLAPTKDLIDEYEINDLRLKKWYYHAPDKVTFTREDGFTFQTEFVATNYGLTKFLDVWSEERYIPSEYDIITGHDIVLFRLSDIYLMYAEAMVEKSGGTTSDAKVMKFVNEIRSRAKVTPFSELTRENIRDERRRELAFEGLRYFDIVRWRIGSEIDGKLVHSDIHVKWDDKFYVWPFSQSELDINRELEQNQGYKN